MLHLYEYLILLHEDLLAPIGDAQRSVVGVQLARTQPALQNCQEKPLKAVFHQVLHKEKRCSSPCRPLDRRPGPFHRRPDKLLLPRAKHKCLNLKDSFLHWFGLHLSRTCSIAGSLKPQSHPWLGWVVFDWGMLSVWHQAENMRHIPIPRSLGWERGWSFSTDSCGRGGFCQFDIQQSQALTLIKWTRDRYVTHFCISKYFRIFTQVD